MTIQVHSLQQSPLVQRSPIFYGWVIWFAATIGIIATAPGQSFSVSLFIDHYIVDFGLDRTTVSGLYGLGTFVAALSLTWVGRRIDRHGNRLMSVIIGVLFSLVLLASSLVMGPITILLSFVAIRGLGQGSLGLVNSTAVAQWFRRRRGWVMGLSLVCFAVFQRLYLPWMQSFIDTHGWRTAWVFSGMVVAVLVVPILGLLIRNRPEDFGLEPDGDKVDREAVSSVPLEENWTLSEVMRTAIFWVFVVARMLPAAWGTALVFHQVSLFGELGHAPTVAANTIGQAALFTAFFTLISGSIIDRMRPGVMVALQMVALGVATALAMVMTETSLLLVYTIAFGAFMGAGAVFDGTVWVTMFGRQHQGAIRGFVVTANVIGTSAGPFIFGLAFDQLGSYDTALVLGIVLAIVASIGALVVKMPKRRLVAGAA